MPPRGDGAERDGRARLAGKPAAGSPAPPVSPRAPTLALGRLQDAACARPLWFFAPSSRLGLSTERLLFERKKNNKIELLVGVRGLCGFAIYFFILLWRPRCFQALFLLPWVSKRSKFVLGGSGLTLLAAFALQCVAVSAAVHDTRTQTFRLV